MRSGASRPSSRTTSRSTGPTWRPKPCGRAWSTSSRRFVFPVVVGGGKRFLPDGVRLDLTLLEVRRFDVGVVVSRYAVRG
jgi:hypothetical protein